jgi:DNA-binding NtrC family response regulator
MQSVLLIDDDSLSLSALATLFEDLPCKVVLHTDPVCAIQQCAQETFEVVITDQRMPGMTGIDVLSNISKLQPDCRRLIISAFSDFDEIVAGFNAGLVHRYLSKPWEAEAVKSNILQELKLATNYSQPGTIHTPEIAFGPNSGLVNFNGLLTCNHKLQKTLGFIRNFASTEAPFCINGETGTGKELVARAIHQAGTRKNKPFIAMNCANLTETLLESQLFGHRKGALQVPSTTIRGCSSLHTGARCFWMKSWNCLYDYRPNCYASCRKRNSTRWGK